jgi:hypothetical protein
LSRRLRYGRIVMASLLTVLVPLAALAVTATV